MRLALLFVAVLVARVAFGFDPPVGRTLTSTFPTNPDSYSSMLPVRLQDVSGLVEGIEVMARPGPGGAPWIVSHSGEPPNDLVIDWLGGACLARIRVLVKPIGAGLRLRLSEERSLGGMLGCMAVGVNRRLVLHLARPMPSDAVQLEYSFG